MGEHCVDLSIYSGKMLNRVYLRLTFHSQSKFINSPRVHPPLWRSKHSIRIFHPVSWPFMSISRSFPSAIFLSIIRDPCAVISNSKFQLLGRLCASSHCYSTQFSSLLWGYHEGFPFAVTSNFVLKTYYAPSLAASWQFCISVAHWYIWQFSWFTVYSSSWKLHGF